MNLHQLRFVREAVRQNYNLTDAAKARAAEKKITFGEALSQIAEEQPELTVTGAARA